MKKVFLSTPMRDRTKEQIEAYRAKQVLVARAMIDDDVVIIDGQMSDHAPDGADEAVFCLGEAIKRMAGADYAVIPANDYRYVGCRVEHMVADLYNIPVIRMPQTDEEREAERAYEVGR